MYIDGRLFDMKGPVELMLRDVDLNYKSVPIVTEMSITLMDIHLDQDFLHIILGRPPRTVGGRTLRQCLQVAENIAMGAWAIRCAEEIVRGAP